LFNILFIGKIANSTSPPKGSAMISYLDPKMLLYSFEKKKSFKNLKKFLKSIGILI
jgi:hypothetical protein